MKQAVIITQGEKGTLIWADKKIQVPAVPPQQILDPTGIGDAFRAGLLKGLALEMDWLTAGRIGSLAATYVLETQGPQAHTYTLSEFASRSNRYQTVLLGAEIFGQDKFTAAVA